MIITLTPNPSVDRAFTLTRLEVDSVNRAHSTRMDAGGKGINIARGLHAHGHNTLAVFPWGGPEGHALREALATAAVPHLAIPIEQGTRSNITLTEASGNTTKINAPGPVLTTTETANLIDQVVDAARQAIATPGSHTVYVVAAGSLPGGVPSDFYGLLGEALAGLGVRYVVDASGEALRGAIGHAAAGVWMVSPNLHELEELTGTACRTVGDVVDSAQALLERGVHQVLVSLDRGGALLVTQTSDVQLQAAQTPDVQLHAGHSSVQPQLSQEPAQVTVWWAGGLPLDPVSSVGSGDLMLAGFLSAGPSIEAQVRAGIAWGRAAVMQPGTAVPTASDIKPDEVSVVRNPPRDLELENLPDLVSL